MWKKEVTVVDGTLRFEGFFVRALLYLKQKLATWKGTIVSSGSGVLVVSKKKKEFPETCMGGMVYWCCTIKRVPLLTSQCFTSAISPWKNTNLVFSWARMKSAAQTLCSILKYPPVQHLASLACVSSCSPLLCFSIQAPSWRPWAHVAAKSTWPWKEQICTPCVCGHK